MFDGTPSCMNGQYGIALVKNGQKLGTAGAKLRRIEYGRNLDASSSATIDLITAGDDCCGQLSRVNHWDTELVVTAVNPKTGRDDEVWRGPVIKPTFRRGSVTIEAKDNLKWLEKRILEMDMTFTSQDVSDIFIALATYAYGKDPAHPIEHEYVRFASGVVESRLVEASSGRMTWSVVQEMLQSGLDVTTLGRKIIVGVPNFKTYELDDTQVIGQVEVVRDGDDFADRVRSNASQDIVGIFPATIAEATTRFPLVEASISDTQLTDVASANAAAKARYDFSKDGVLRVVASGGLQLLPSSNIDPRRLVCGQLIGFTATETCFKARSVLRLGSLTVTVEKGQETAVIELQPVGGVTPLEGG